MLYFNGLGEQDEEIRLTIGISVYYISSHIYYCTHTDTTQNTEIVTEADDLVSPLELCIRTWLVLIYIRIIAGFCLGHRPN